MTYPPCLIRFLYKRRRENAKTKLKSKSCVRACIRALLCFALLPILFGLFYLWHRFPSLFLFLHQTKKEMARTRLQKIWNSLLPSHAFIVTISSMNCLVSNALDPGITTNEREEDMFGFFFFFLRQEMHTSPYSTSIIVASNNNNSSNMEVVLLVLFFCRKSLLVYPPLVSSIA